MLIKSNLHEDSFNFIDHSRDASSLRRSRWSALFPTPGVSFEPVIGGQTENLCRFGPEVCIGRLSGKLDVALSVERLGTHKRTRAITKLKRISSYSRPPPRANHELDIACGQWWWISEWQIINEVRDLRPSRRPPFLTRRAHLDSSRRARKADINKGDVISIGER